MQRETKIIITPVSKQKVEIYTYITGREKRSMVNVFLDGKVNFNSDTQQLGGISSTTVDKAQELAWNTVVVSIDGVKENIVDRILDMRDIDYNFVVNAVNEVTKDQDFEQKKTI